MYYSIYLPFIDQLYLMILWLTSFWLVVISRHAYPILIKLEHMCDNLT